VRVGALPHSPGQAIVAVHTLSSTCCFFLCVEPVAIGGQTMPAAKVELFSLAILLFYQTKKSPSCTILMFCLHLHPVMEIVCFKIFL
jgi:hypothetical protein